MPAKPLTPSTQIEMLSTILEWEGQLDNPRIRELFGVQAVRASRLMSELIEVLGPRVRGQRSPVEYAYPARRSKSSPETYARLLGITRGAAGDKVLVDGRVDMTSIHPDVFSALRRAAIACIGVRIRYTAFDGHQTREELVFPHSIVQTTRRWHVRAWSAPRRRFRDFVLSRIQYAELVEDSAPLGRDADEEWCTMVDLVLVPHPSLSPDQQSTVADQYFPGAAARRLRIRKALAGYLIQDQRIATDPARQLPPEFELALVSAQAGLMPFETED